MEKHAVILKRALWHMEVGPVLEMSRYGTRQTSSLSRSSPLQRAHKQDPKHTAGPGLQTSQPGNPELALALLEPHANKFIPDELQLWNTSSSVSMTFLLKFLYTLN